MSLCRILQTRKENTRKTNRRSVKQKLYAVVCNDCHNKVFCLICEWNLVCSVHILILCRNSIHVTTNNTNKTDTNTADTTTTNNNNP